MPICYRPELLERFMRAAHDIGLSRRVEQAADPEHECFEIAKLCGRLGIPPRIERESNGYSASVALG
jgi:hypothetical protein